jgi:hypothetical protein
VGTVEHVASNTTALFGHWVAIKHGSYFIDTFLIRELCNMGRGTRVRYLLRNGEVRVAKGGDLRKMRNTEDLVVTTNVPQLFTND